MRLRLRLSAWSGQGGRGQRGRSDGLARSGFPARVVGHGARARSAPVRPGPSRGASHDGRNGAGAAGPRNRPARRPVTGLAEHADGYGAVRVAANAAPTAGFLGPELTAFLAAHPRAPVDVRQQPGPHVVEAVADHRFDLGGLEASTLRADPLVVVTPPEDPLAGRESVRYADVVNRPFVRLGNTAEFPLPLDTRPTFRAHLATVDAVCHAVRTGVGVAILPRHSIDGWARSGWVATIALDERWAVRSLVLCCRAEADLWLMTAKPTPRAMTVRRLNTANPAHAPRLSGPVVAV